MCVTCIDTANNSNTTPTNDVVYSASSSPLLDENFDTSVEGNSEVEANVTGSVGNNAGSYSNDFINGLIWGGGWDSTTVYYEVDQGVHGGGGWLSHQLTAIDKVMELWGNVCGLTFTELSAGHSATDIVFATVDNNTLPGTLGMHEVPNDNNLYGGAEVCYGLYNWQLFNSDTDSFDMGGYDFITLLHEVGHGLGLAHPHDGGGSSSVYSGVSSSGDMGDNNLNQGIFTTMSYMDGNPANFSSHSDAGYGYQATPMAFDIAAIQELYGANNSYNTGNNTYTLATVNAQNSNTYWSCIWDAGGTDTISNSGSSIACTINLNEAPLTGTNAGGYISSNSGINGGFTIANGATIENAIGGSGSDTITLNSANNEIDGNGGTDTVVFNDTKANVISTFGFHHNNTSAIVIKGTYGTDTIVDCENIQFSDGTISVADLKTEYSSSYKPLFANATSGEAPFMMADTYTGAVSGIQWQYLAEIGLDGNTVVGSTGNDFINLLGGDDAAVGGAGDDILDGGRGSNFLTGGDGTDTFFLDGRGSSSVIWSTITDWDNTEELSVWGWGSNSTISWEENQGTSGYEGATFSIDLNGNGVVDMKCTFTGFAVAEIKSPTEFEDSDLLWFV